ncbi:MAG TPA: hypothetical protein VF399_13200 [bacterium]
MLVVFLIANFATQYQDFINSPQKDSIYVALTRKDINITEFAENPVVLWFWRTNADDPMTDSLLKKVPMERNFYLSAVLRWEALEAKTYDGAMQKLDLATHFDTLAIENFLSRTALDLKNRQYRNVLSSLLTAPFLSDFRNQVLLITNSFILVFAAVVLCSLIYVLVKFLYYVPVLSHRLDIPRHYFLKGAVSFLILLIPLLVFRNLYIMYVIYGLLLMLVLHPKEKNWLRFGVFLILLLAVGSYPLNRFIPFLQGTSKSYQLYRLVNYDGEQRIQAENNTEKELMALALKQQGKIDEALSVYEELYYKGNRGIAVTNNLANLYLLYDEDAKAEELYVLALNQNRGEPYFNLGLLKLKNIEYLASSEYMEKARLNGFTSIARDPVDITPGNRTFYELVLGKNFEMPRFINPIFLIPLVFILIVSFLRLKLSPPYFCAICGKAVCRDCVEEGEEEGTCKDCVNKIKSTKSSDIEEDLRISMSRRNRVLKRILVYVINVIIPGAGLVYQKQDFLGLIVLFLVSLAYIPHFFGGLFVKPSNWICLTLAPLFAAATIILLIISYIASFIFLKGTSHAD